MGSLTTSDPDNSHGVRQTFSYRIVDSANGRFKVDGSVVKVPHTQHYGTGNTLTLLILRLKFPTLRVWL